LMMFCSLEAKEKSTDGILILFLPYIT